MSILRWRHVAKMTKTAKNKKNGRLRLAFDKRRDGITKDVTAYGLWID